MADDKIWRNLVNSVKVDLPEDGDTAPKIESIQAKEPKKKFFVQKIITTVYVYTDDAEKMFGQEAFQETWLLGEMTAEKMVKLLEREKRKRQKGS